MELGKQIPPEEYKTIAIDLYCGIVSQITYDLFCITNDKLLKKWSSININKL